MFLSSSSVVRITDCSSVVEGSDAFWSKSGTSFWSLLLESFASKAGSFVDDTDMPVTGSVKFESETIYTL